MKWKPYNGIILGLLQIYLLKVKLKRCKWVYKIKCKSSGEVERYKARLVAKRFSQKERIDYDNTNSHVAKMEIVRCVLNFVVQYNCSLYQLDINNAFLYGDLSEDMSLPLGY